MSALVDTAQTPSTTPVSPTDADVLRQNRAPIPFGRLLRVQFLAWRAQRGLVWLTILATVLGLGATAFLVSTITGKVTTKSVEGAFASASSGFLLLWLAIGVVAGAAPFRSGWAAVILSIAPRRLRWLAASFLSMLGWALGATAVFAFLAWAVATGCLAARGHHFELGAGVFAHLPHLAAEVLLTVAMGFALGAATRSVSTSLMVGYVAPALVPALDLLAKGSSTWLDLQAATGVVAGTQHAPHGLGPVFVALASWILLPAAIAVLRLRRHDLR